MSGRWKERQEQRGGVLDWRGSLSLCDEARASQSACREEENDGVQVAFAHPTSSNFHPFPVWAQVPTPITYIAR